MEEELVGRAVKREFLGLGIIKGAVKSYDPINGYFEIVYEDGDSEEMDFNEVASILEGGVDQCVAQRKIQEGSFERRPKKRRLRGGHDSGNSGLIVEGNVETLVKKCGVGEDLLGSHSSNGNLNEKVGFGGFDLNVDISMGEEEEEEDGCVYKNSKQNETLDRSTNQKVEHSFDINLGLEEEIEEIQDKGLNLEGEFDEVAAIGEGGNNEREGKLAEEEVLKDVEETQLMADVCLKEDTTSTVIREMKLKNGNGSSEGVIGDVSLKENASSMAAEETQSEGKETCRRKKRGRPKKLKSTKRTVGVVQCEEKGLGENCRGVASDNTSASFHLEVDGSDMVITKTYEGTPCLEPPDKGESIHKKRGRPRRSTLSTPADVIIQSEHEDIGQDSTRLISNCTDSYFDTRVDGSDAVVAEKHENKTFSEPADMEAYNHKKRGRPKKVKSTTQTVLTNGVDGSDVILIKNHEQKICLETPDKGACSGKKRGRSSIAKPTTEMASTIEVGTAGMISAGREDKTCLETPDKKEFVLSLSANKTSNTPKKRGKPSQESNLQTVLRRSSRRSSSTPLNHVTTVDESFASNAASSSHKNNVVLDSKFDGFREQIDLPPKPELPPSSKNLNIDEIPMIDLFSVYSCLRSFSTVLFLSPFSLEAFLEALKHSCPNSIIDSIHFSILHTLKLHMEFLSDEGSPFATTCLRSLNWALLDIVTWPIYVAEYLLFRGSSLKPGFELSHLKFLMGDYYKQSPSLKIWILQCLCDDVIEAETVRSEINRRTQASELDIDVDRIPSIEMKRKRKDQVDEGGGSCLTQDVDEAADWNSDECCLCKMDGSLICCDGCPAAYHLRCVGIAKNTLPEGEWFCPECAINKHDIRMKSSKSNSLRGAELLGIDPHGRLYFATCGYLLVLDSCDPESSYNFYNSNDLIFVIEVLKSSSVSYGGIIDAISKNWGVLGEEGYMNSQADMTCKVLDMNRQMFPSIGGPPPDTTEVKPVVKQHETSIRNEDFDLQGYKLSDTVIKHDSRFLNNSIETRNSITRFEAVAEISRAAEVSYTCQETGENCFKGLSKVPSQSDVRGDSHSTIAENSLQSTVSCVALEKSLEAAPSHESVVRNPCQVHSEPGYYVNCYTFGQTAASVGGELMRLTAEKAKEGFQWSLEDIILAQLRAILEKSTYFCWSDVQWLHPTPEKEDCGWCFYCRNPSENETCLFNMTCKKPTLDGLTGGAVALHSKKSKQSHLLDVISYVLSIEERLSGLLSGPWKNASYSKNWRKNVLKAPNVASVKPLLLTLESNLRRLAFLPEWFKHVDSVVTLGSASHVMTTAAPVSSSKHVGGRKRAKSTVIHCDSSVTAAPKTSTLWWRGGRVSRQLFNYKVLPHSLASKGGRQAGCKKIADILYPDGSEFAKRTKYIAWRASVEMSTSVAHLAYLVRELDSNIRWDDLENTQYFPHLSKESRKAMKLFKKVTIRRKITEGTKAKYLLDFGKRRAIPNIVKRNGKMLEVSASERKKYWLEESLLPLHILKAYEEKKLARTSSKMKHRPPDEVGKISKKSSRKSGLSSLLSKGQKSENYKCGHCNKDVLIREAVICQDCEGYFHRRHVRKSEDSSVAEYTYQCQRCRCGNKIVVLSPVKAKPKKKKVQSQKNKKALQWQKGKKTSLNGRRKPLPRKVKYRPVQGKKLLREKKCNRVKSKTQQSKSKEELCWFKGGRTQVSYSYWLNGLQLNKSSNDARALQFRESRLLLPSQHPSADFMLPTCQLCSEASYRSTAIYVNCADCQGWFHGEAFGITAENSCMILGFRCHMCRNRSPPACPYLQDALINEVGFDEGGNRAVTECATSACVSDKQTNKNCEEQSISPKENANIDECGHRGQNAATKLDMINNKQNINPRTKYFRAKKKTFGFSS